ncbi:hypothetical protein [Arthrobacter sp. VKM Ac-2550]|uniref:hypothetical protein n=1 Tax=Crystallibacter permensis TaxID=1938888 RepID=UPI0022262AFB|nr:hypothetical protein [Arthrobacter sp. VKM Ac-2550]MCW2132897.1 hypothetical protein [Arthrobacter sp. VKM Ac-2550]
MATKDPEPADMRPVTCKCGRIMLTSPSGEWLSCPHCDAPHAAGHGAQNCMSCRMLDAAIKRLNRAA